MCGIAGIVDASRPAIERERIVHMMLQYVVRRGPDASAVKSLGPATFGCRRLAIVDLAGGAQPRVNDGRSMFTMNGEIFNYNELVPARTVKGDTEALHHALDEGGSWDRKAEGQYALGYFNLSDRSLLLARDSNGILPLYFAHLGNGLLFGSDARSFRAAGFELDLEPSTAVSAAVLWGAPSGCSVFRGVQQVRRGEMVRLSMETSPIKSVSRKLDDQSGTASATSDLVPQLQVALQDAVEARVPQEVPYAVLLSGGLDSTAIAALALTCIRRPACAYGIGFDSDDLDESVYQHTAADSIGLELRSIQLDARSLIEALEETVLAVGAPLVRTAPIASLLLARLIHADGIKVVMSGEGADEYFGGYQIYKDALFFSEWDGRNLDSARRYAQLVSSAPGEQRRVEPAFLEAVQAWHNDSQFSSHKQRWVLTSRSLGRLLSPEVCGESPYAAATGLLLDSMPESTLPDSLLDRARMIECETLLQGTLLAQQSDRVMMRYSVEARYPFLASKVRALALGADWSELIDAKWTEKAILRESLAALAPAKIVGRTKQAYAAPTQAMFATDNGEYFADLMQGLDDRGWLRSGASDWLVRRVRSSRPMSVYDDVSIVWLASSEILMRSLE